ncbi:metal-sulfur cluster assembly factor [candidate division KSB1 bacterium]
MLINEEIVLEALKPVQDPEIALSIVDLGLVYGADVDNEEKKVTVRMTLTSPMCPYGPMIVQEVNEVLKLLPDIKETHVDIVWDPQWDPKTMASDEVKDIMGIW